MRKTLTQRAFDVCRKPALQLVKNYVDSCVEDATPTGGDPILTAIDTARAAYLTFMARIGQSGAHTPAVDGTAIPNRAPTLVRLSVETSTSIASASHPDRTMALDVQLLDLSAPVVMVTYEGQRYHLPLSSIGTQWVRLVNKNGKALRLRICRPIPGQKTIDIGFE